MNRLGDKSPSEYNYIDPSKVEYVDDTKTIYKMTDLEALESIVVDLTPTAKIHNREEIEQIKKSLEVLEILKPMLEIKKGSSWEYLDTKHCFFDTQEQIEIIKEWLENE